MSECIACYCPTDDAGCTNDNCARCPRHPRYVAPPEPPIEPRLARKARVLRRQASDANFDGQTYVEETDKKRLGQQLARTLEAMKDGAWRTLAEIAKLADAPEASVSARLRDLRKPKFGGHSLRARRRGGGGVWEYRLDG